MDYYTFYAGTAFDVWKDMGAHVTNDGTTFTVYAPNARSVSLIGEFNNWQPAEMERLALGNEKVKAQLEGKNVVKVICVPKRVVNIVAK